MFPLAKLARLPEKAQLRKIALILQKIEIDMARGDEPDSTYLDGLSRAVLSSAFGQKLKDAAPAWLCPLPVERADMLRTLNSLRHNILTYLGTTPAEWDLLDLESGGLEKDLRKIFPIKLYLEDIRSPFNVGSIFRTAEAFGVEHIFISPFTPLPTHKRAAKTARGCEQSIAWSVAGLSALDELDGLFALELGGTPIDEFVFPRQGVALIGSEELGLSPEALELAAARAGRVSIPMAGAKRSLNVATAAGILLHKWFESVNGHSGAKHTSRQEMNEK